MSTSGRKATTSQLSIADDGVGLNVKSDPRSTGMGQRIVTAMASKLEASVERDPAHAGTRIVLRFRRANAAATNPAQRRRASPHPEERPLGRVSKDEATALSRYASGCSALTRTGS